MGVKGKRVVVTGAAQGIGRAIAGLLAEQGASLLLCDVNLEKTEETAREIAAGGATCLACRADVTKSADAEALMQEAVQRLGAVEVLVNNAGITRDNVLLRMKEDQWDQVMAVNLKGTFNCTKSAIRVMLRQKKGRLSTSHPSPVSWAMPVRPTIRHQRRVLLVLPRQSPASMPTGG